MAAKTNSSKALKAPKNNSSKALQAKVACFKSSTIANPSSGSHARRGGPITRSKSKAAAQASAQAALLPKPSSAVGADLSKVSPTFTSSSKGKEGDSTMEAAKDMATIIENPFVYPPMLHESASEIQKNTEEGYSSSSDSTSSRSTPLSNLNAFTKLGSSSIMDVMTINAVSLEEQVSRPRFST